MPTLSTVPTSRRGYLSQAELEQFADIIVDDATEADDQISQAEEMIDGYIGATEKFFPHILQGKVSVGGSTTVFSLDSIHINSSPYVDFYKNLIVEIIGGTGAGERRKITGSTDAGVITTEAFSTALDTTSFYKIYQLGKFPRRCPEDVFFNTHETPSRYYKSIPEAVKKAVAAQIEFKISKGDSYFSSDASEKISESIGDYSYSKKGSTGAGALISPKAKVLLKGYIKRTGEIILA